MPLTLAHLADYRLLFLGIELVGRVPISWPRWQQYLVPFIVFWALLSQSTDPTPIKIGAATQLTGQDIAAINKLLPEKPWLVNGPPTQFSFQQFLQAYLPPTTTSGIRRGTYSEVVRRLELRTGRPMGEWTTDRRYEYAQVAIPGRPFDEIRDEHDLNRPFRVLGNFEDEAIIGIVAAIRSQAGKARYGFETIHMADTWARLRFLWFYPHHDLGTICAGSVDPSATRREQLGYYRCWAVDRMNTSAH
jgi:hypothetical protein